MTTDAATQSTCAVCTQSFRLDDLVSVGGYPACRTCLESAPVDAGAPAKVQKYRKIVHGKQIAGVCGGLADTLNMDRDTFRVISFVAACMTGFFPGIIVYLVLAFVLPTADQ